MKFVSEALPERVHRKAKWSAYVPMVKEFAESDLNTARIVVEGDDEKLKPITLRNRILLAIEATCPDDVAVSMRGGALYLVRKEA